MKNVILIVIFTAIASYAIKNVAVLEVIPNGDIDLEVRDFQYLTDELRSNAVSVLPKSEYSVLTRDGIFALLPPDEEEAECLAEGCAVDIGRAINAEYVAQGRISVFGGMLVITVELYESMSGALLGSFNGEGENVHNLLNIIRERAAPMFQKILPKTEQAPPVVQTPVQPATPTKQETIATANSENSLNSENSGNKKDKSLRLGFTVKGGIAKNGFAASGGLVMFKKIGFIDLKPELLASITKYKIEEAAVQSISIEVPVTANFNLNEEIALSIGGLLGIPMVSKIEDKVPSDMTGISAAIVFGAAYFFSENMYADAGYKMYFTKMFNSLESSKADEILCGLGYLF